MDLWYAHQGITVYMLTKLPEGSTRKIGYADSGWTTYERCSAEQIKKFYLYEAKWKLVLDLGAATGQDAAGQRGWPVGPDDFDKLVAEKKFTNGADEVEVKKLFRKMSINQLGGINELTLHTMPPPNIEDARCLGGCLNMCSNLLQLGLASVGMTDESCKVMFSTLASGARSRTPECQRRQFGCR